MTTRRAQKPGTMAGLIASILGFGNVGIWPDIRPNVRALQHIRLRDLMPLICRSYAAQCAALSNSYPALTILLSIDALLPHDRSADVRPGRVGATENR
jgi:hypothetical protein